MPIAKLQIMPGQDPDEPTLVNDALSRRLSSLGPVTSTVPPAQGTKRKASNMENLESSYGSPPMGPPIKLEPDLPNPFDYEGSTMRDSHPELCDMPAEYVSCSSSDDTDVQMLDIEEDGATTTRRRAAGMRLNLSSRDRSAPVKQEAETHATKVTLPNTIGGTSGSLSPLSMLDKFTPPNRQDISGRLESPRHSTGNKSEDLAYNSVPDYTPPISTLPKGDPHILRVQWRQKSYVNLSNDPDRHMLHEAEVNLATSLNLSCAKYLITKRRIFQARFKALQEGREFRRSDSQKACKINSNKAGKLCSAFEKVGWFDKKYFLGYLEDSNSTLKIVNIDIKDKGSPSSGLTEPGIWDVSDSEFHSTSEGDEESTDDDTADSSVCFDGRHDETEGWKNYGSYQENSLRKQSHGLSLIGKDGSPRKVPIDRTVRFQDALSGAEDVDESPMVEGRRPRRGAVLKSTVDFPVHDGLSGDVIAEAPVLETRSMTQKIKLALDSHSGDKSDRVPITEAKSSHRKSTSKDFHRRAAPTNHIAARNPIPHSLDEASSADIMLLKMKEKGHPWPEIEEAWAKETGKTHTIKTLTCRYARIMANFANTRRKSVKAQDSQRSLAHPLLEPDDVHDKGSIAYPKPSSPKQDQLLLAAEAEIEGNFQREKAELIAEIENNFQSEKWDLVSEAISRRGLTRYSAETIQAQFERLARDPKSPDAKEKENLDTTCDLPRRTTRAVGGKTETSTPDEASNATRLSQPQRPRLLLYQKRPDSKIQATTAMREKAIREDRSQAHAKHSARMLKVWAKRRAMGTNGYKGGPPKARATAKEAKVAVTKAAPNAGIPLAPTVTYQSGHSPELLPNQTAPMVIGKEVCRDVKQHKQPFAPTIPAAPHTDSDPEPINTSRTVPM